MALTKDAGITDDKGYMTCLRADVRQREAQCQNALLVEVNCCVSSGGNAFLSAVAGSIDGSQGRPATSNGECRGSERGVVVGAFVVLVEDEAAAQRSCLVFMKCWWRGSMWDQGFAKGERRAWLAKSTRY